jgi:hypothetical protein
VVATLSGFEALKQTEEGLKAEIFIADDCKTVLSDKRQPGMYYLIERFVLLV